VGCYRQCCRLAFWRFSVDPRMEHRLSRLGFFVVSLSFYRQTFLHKQCSGIVPTVDQSLLKGDESLPNCKAILDKAMNHLSKYEFNQITLVIINISSEANAYIDRSAPWILSKTSRERRNLVIYKLLEYIRIIGILLQPIVPRSAEQCLD